MYAQDESQRVYYRYEEIADPSKDNVQAVRVPDQEGPATPAVEKAAGFWRRQFRPEVTGGQKKFDWTFGVVLPVICIFFDPVVFESKFHSAGLLAGIKPFAYLLSFMAIMATMAWLLWGEKLRWLGACLSGLFAVSSLTALAIGIFLLPFSLFGLLFFFLGALGFTPLFSAFVFLRNSVRAFSAAKLSADKAVAKNIFALAAFASAVIPYLFNLR